MSLADEKIRFPGTIKARVRTCVLAWAFTWERVTGIEPALSAWESVRSGLVYRLTCGAVWPQLTVRNP